MQIGRLGGRHRKPPVVESQIAIHEAIGILNGP
jgi:hypothetical protein